MKNLERFSTIFLIAGLVSFIVAFLTLGVWPAMMTEELPDQGMPTRVPKNFQKYYSNVDDYTKALLRGRDIYIKEACWHCHSQYVRPVGNEATRYGLVSTAAEYQNILNLPHLFGTRRVGPDLVREAGKRTNDWHFAHLYNPKFVEPESVMPPYTWFFNKDKTPNADGIALVAYLQNLGKWAEDVSMSTYNINEVTMPPSQK